MTPPDPTVPAVDSSWNDEEAAQKRFNVMAGVGVVVVLLLGYFAFAGGDDEASQAVGVSPDPAAAPAAVAEAPAPAAPAPLPPGLSGGAQGGGGGGGGGRPTNGPAPTRPAGYTADQGRAAAVEHYTSRGLPPRAAAALADSAARRSQPSGSGGAAVTARVARATVLMASPGIGAAATIPAGASLTVSGCKPQGGEAWCQVSYNGMTGYVLQSDVQG